MISILNFILYLAAFVAIWWGAGLIINSVDKIAKKLHLSSFAISFFILGLLTSIPEMAISSIAVAEHDPEIFVGLLLGGVVVIFLFIIPLLAILGKGIKINHGLDQTNLILALIVIALPSFLVIDRRVTNLEGFLMVISYCILLYRVQGRHGIFDKHRLESMHLKAYSFVDLAKVVFGSGVVYFSSKYLVDQTIAFSQSLLIPAFFFGLIILSVGTNLPEITLAIRAIMSGKKDVAFGDYLGSAAANTLLFGLFTLINDGEIFTVNHFIMTFGFIVISLLMFYHFSQSKMDISTKEGYYLLTIYVLFLLYELSRSFNLIP